MLTNSELPTYGSIDLREERDALKLAAKLLNKKNDGSYKHDADVKKAGVLLWVLYLVGGIAAVTQAIPYIITGGRGTQNPVMLSLNLTSAIQDYILPYWAAENAFASNVFLGAQVIFIAGNYYFLSNLVPDEEKALQRRPLRYQNDTLKRGLDWGFLLYALILDIPFFLLAATDKDVDSVIGESKWAYAIFVYFATLSIWLFSANGLQTRTERQCDKYSPLQDARQRAKAALLAESNQAHGDWLKLAYKDKRAAIERAALIQDKIKRSPYVTQAATMGQTLEAILHHNTDLLFQYRALINEATHTSMDILLLRLFEKNENTSLAYALKKYFSGSLLQIAGKSINSVIRSSFLFMIVALAPQGYAHLARAAVDVIESAIQHFDNDFELNAVIAAIIYTFLFSLILSGFMLLNLESGTKVYDSTVASMQNLFSKNPSRNLLEIVAPRFARLSRVFDLSQTMVSGFSNMGLNVAFVNPLLHTGFLKFYGYLLSIAGFLGAGIANTYFFTSLSDQIKLSVLIQFFLNDVDTKLCESDTRAFKNFIELIEKMSPEAFQLMIQGFYELNSPELTTLLDLVFARNNMTKAQVELLKVDPTPETLKRQWPRFFSCSKKPNNDPIPLLPSHIHASSSSDSAEPIPLIVPIHARMGAS